MLHVFILCLHSTVENTQTFLVPRSRALFNILAFMRDLSAVYVICLGCTSAVC